MGLQFKVDTLEGVDENTAKLYVKDGDSYKLDVEGIDAADRDWETSRNTFFI